MPQQDQGQEVKGCPRCERRMGYLRSDGTYRCQRCGYDGPAFPSEDDSRRDAEEGERA